MGDSSTENAESGKVLSFKKKVIEKAKEESRKARTRAIDAYRFNGRSTTSPWENPAGEYLKSEWQPFGKFPQYPRVVAIGKLVGYRLVCTQREGGWFHLYFDAKGDRGGSLRRVDFWEGKLDQLVRSDILDEGVVDPLSEFTPVNGEVLTAVAAFRTGDLVFTFGEAEASMEWHCPLEADKKPGYPVEYKEGRSNFERVFVSTLLERL